MPRHRDKKPTLWGSKKRDACIQTVLQQTACLQKPLSFVRLFACPPLSICTKLHTPPPLPEQFRSPPKQKSPTNIVGGAWWRRRESNPGPKVLGRDYYVCSRCFSHPLGTFTDTSSLGLFRLCFRCPRGEHRGCYLVYFGAPSHVTRTTRGGRLSVCFLGSESERIVVRVSVFFRRIYEVTEPRHATVYSVHPRRNRYAPKLGANRDAASLGIVEAVVNPVLWGLLKQHSLAGQASRSGEVGWSD